MVENVLRVTSCRAQAELKGRQPLTAREVERFRSMVPDVGLEGALFDEMSWVYPFRIPVKPHVVVLGENPRCISVGVRFTRGRLVGVIGDATLEAEYLAHKGAFLYVVGALKERKQGDKIYLNVRPRSWVVVEVGGSAPDPASPARNGGGRRKK